MGSCLYSERFPSLNEQEEHLRIYSCMNEHVIQFGSKKKNFISPKSLFVIRAVHNNPAFKDATIQDLSGPKPGRARTRTAPPPHPAPVGLQLCVMGRVNIGQFLLSDDALRFWFGSGKWLFDLLPVPASLRLTEPEPSGWSHLDKTAQDALWHRNAQLSLPG